MKKRIMAILMASCLALSLAGCGKEMTLNLSYGDRTGTYSGDVDENGVPNGQGKFTTTNDAGEKWTYEGAFVNGHFEGEGKTTWKSGQIEIGTYKDDVIVPMKGKEIKTLYTTPENFLHRCVEVVGVVFAAPEYVDDGVCIQIMTDIKNHENNTIVYIHDKDFEVNNEDYVRIVGIVGEPFKGENALGGEITAPTITASEYEVLDYKDAVAPTLKEYEVNQTQTQYGYSVTVQKIEFAEEETRVYVKADNQGSDTFNLYSFNAKITQNGKQYEEQDAWDADYPKLQDDLLKGNSTEGVIVYPTLEEKPFTITIEAYSSNYEEEIKPYTFNIEF